VNNDRRRGTAKKEERFTSYKSGGLDEDDDYDVRGGRPFACGKGRGLDEDDNYDVGGGRPFARGEF